MRTLISAIAAAASLLAAQTASAQFYPNPAATVRIWVPGYPCNTDAYGYTQCGHWENRVVIQTLPPRGYGYRPYQAERRVNSNAALAGAVGFALGVALAGHR